MPQTLHPPLARPVPVRPEWGWGRGDLPIRLRLGRDRLVLEPGQVFHGGAGADQILVAVTIIDATHVWPELVLVNDRPRLPQSQGSVERANGVMKNNSLDV